MKQLGFLDFDIHVDKAANPLVKLENTVNFEIFRPLFEGIRNNPIRGIQGREALMLLYFSKHSFFNRFIIWRIKRWKFKYSIDIHFPVSRDGIDPIKFLVHKNLTFS
jgi:hypothetical protein